LLTESQINFSLMTNKNNLMKKSNYLIITMIGIVLLAASCTNTEKKPMTAKQIPLEDFSKTQNKQVTRFLLMENITLTRLPTKIG